MLAENIVKDAYIRTLHKGVSLAMADVQREYWIPCLWSLTIKVRKACYGCKRFQVTTETGENSASLNVNSRECIPERTAAVAAKFYKSGMQLNTRGNSLLSNNICYLSVPDRERVSEIFRTFRTSGTF